MTNERNEEGLALLEQLALNLRSTWNHAADDIWAQIDPELWALTSNPWLVLQSAAPARLRELVSTSELRGQLEHAAARLRQALGEDTWFRRAHATAPFQSVAYFCMEYASARS